MKRVKVPGTGCVNCRTTLKLIQEVARERGIDIALEKVERIEDIVAAGVMRTPGVIVEGRIVHAGGVPSREAIAGWLQAARPASAKARRARHERIRADPAPLAVVLSVVIP